MQTFKEYFSGADTAVREPQPELDSGNVRIKSQQLLQLRDEIRKYREAGAAPGGKPLSRREVDDFQHRISSIASELEGSRLPIDAEGAAADAYNDLRAMSESIEDQGLRESILEASDLIKSLISEEAIEEGILNKQDA